MATVLVRCPLQGPQMTSRMPPSRYADGVWVNAAISAFSGLNNTARGKEEDETHVLLIVGVRLRVRLQSSTLFWLLNSHARPRPRCRTPPCACDSALMLGGGSAGARPLRTVCRPCHAQTRHLHHLRMHRCPFTFLVNEQPCNLVSIPLFLLVVPAGCGVLCG